MTGVRAGEVSGDASVENGDCRRRMDRSSEGRDQEGRGLRLRHFPLREAGGAAEVISSITSMSRDWSRSRIGPSEVSSSGPASSSLIGWCLSTDLISCFSEGSEWDWCPSLVDSVAMTTSLFRLCDWLYSSSTFLLSANGGWSPLGDVA